MHLIVAEQALDGVPDGERRRARLVDEVEHLGVHRGLEPIDHAVVVEDPFGVALVEGRRREDVGCEAELPENGVEAAAPLAVIGLLEAEGDGDVGADVDLLDDGRRSRWRATSPASSKEEEEWQGEAMAVEEEVGTNGFSREDCSLLDTMKEGIEMERTTAKL